MLQPENPKKRYPLAVHFLLVNGPLVGMYYFVMWIQPNMWAPVVLMFWAGWGILRNYNTYRFYCHEYQASPHIPGNLQGRYLFLGGAIIATLTWLLSVAWPFVHSNTI